MNYGDDQFLSARAAWPSRQLPSQHSRRFKFQLDLGKAPLADNFAAPVEKDPLVDVNVEVQRQSTTRQGAAGNALDSQCRFTTDRLWRKVDIC